MDWLIVEDSLENRGGHWFEYLASFQAELPRLGDRVTWLVCHNAKAEVLKHFAAQPVLPASICRRMSDGASAWRRCLRIPIHARETYAAVRRFVGTRTFSGVIFVPTVTAHHLLGWYWLVKRIFRRHPVKVLLVFPGLPLSWRDGEVSLDGSPSARLMRLLFRRLQPEIAAGKVILGVETEAMRRAAERVFGARFTYFPHPVSSVLASAAGVSAKPSGPIIMAGYGAARHEKGSDILLATIETFLARYPNRPVRFVMQWLGGFGLADGQTCRLPESLTQNARVEVIDRLFAEGEYARRLAATQVLLLPYRRSSYALRVSRVVIEALVNGIPVIVTRGTTLAEQAEQFGAAVPCDDENEDSLLAAMEQAGENCETLQVRAREQQPKAAAHFSVANFRKILAAADGSMRFSNAPEPRHEI